MTVSDRSKRFDPTQRPKPVARPKIWVEGRQRPRFAARAYLAAAHGMARRDLDPAILDAVQRLQAFGGQVERGELRVTAAWAQRVIPSHRRVGAWLLALARLLADSRCLIVPEAASSPPPIPRTTVEPTLHAIRSALVEVPHDDSTAPPLPPATPGGRLLWPVATRITLAVLMAFALPAGAIKALLFHLDGGDLADWS